MLEILSPNKYAGRVKPIRLIVVHTMEVAESPAAAEAVARAFASPARKASAHVCADTNSRVRCVPDADTAWAAPGANADGLQLELAGYARQDLAGWSDPASVAVLEQGVQQGAEWVLEHGIPTRHLSVAQILAGEAGFVEHADVSAAYHRSTHWDPGPSFPWDTFLARVAVLAGTAPTTPAPAPAAPPAPAPASTGLVVDGLFGPATKKALQRALGVTADGLVGPVTVRALQRRVGATADGVWGPKTTKALQRHLGVTVDGVAGPQTYSQLQRRLNAGTF